MKTLRSFVVSAAVTLIGLGLPAAAGAHVEVSPAKVPAGKPVNMNFEIGHGCSGAATTSLVVQIPPGVTEVSGKPVKGWKVNSTPKRLVWTGGPLGDHEHQAYPFRATFYGKKGDRVLFKSIQKCEGGAETAWIAASGGSSEADNPAPAVTLRTAAEEPPAETELEADEVAEDDAAVTGEPTATDADTEDSSDDGGGRSLLLLIVAGLAIGTVAGIIVRSRRK